MGVDVCIGFKTKTNHLIQRLKIAWYSIWIASSKSMFQFYEVPFGLDWIDSFGFQSAHSYILISCPISWITLTYIKYNILKTNITKYFNKQQLYLRHIK